MEALPHGTDPQAPHLLVIPTEMSTYRREGSVAQDRKDSKPGEYMVQAPSGMEGARSFWQNHLSCIRLLLSVQRGGNESSALFCTPTPTEATGSERERDAGKAQRHVPCGLLLPGNYSILLCVTQTKISPQITCTIDSRAQNKAQRQHLGRVEAGSG